MKKILLILAIIASMAVFSTSNKDAVASPTTTMDGYLFYNWCPNCGWNSDCGVVNYFMDCPRCHYNYTAIGICAYVIE